jgi:hypothetical protein
LTTNKPGDGAMVGEFRVVVHQVTQKERRTADGQKGETGPIAVVGNTDRVPEVYADSYKSPLRATVEAKSPNEIDISIKRE